MKRAILLVAVMLLALSAASGSAQQSIATGWNLLGGPTGTRFPGATAVFAYPPGADAYQPVMGATRSAGLGYWVYYPAPGQPLFAPETICTITWSAEPGVPFLAGNPSATTSARITGAAVVYVYDAALQAYQAATTLAPGRGAWVYPDASGVVTIDASPCGAQVGGIGSGGTPITTSPPSPARPAATSPPPRTSAKCSDFPNQAAAQQAYRANPQGLASLDGDRDGIACERLPCPCDRTPVPRPARMRGSASSVSLAIPQPRGGE